MKQATAALQQAYILALVGVPILLFYATAQAVLSAFFTAEGSDLKLVLEAQLLFVAVILHVQWRSVHRLFREQGLPRPAWIIAADCLTFVITFWTLSVLGKVFIH